MTASPIVHRDDRTRDVPGIDSPWDEWVSGSSTRHFCLDDPCLDWLDLYGDERGFVRDPELPGYDPRLDFAAFVMNKGVEFEAVVMRHLESRAKVVWVGVDPGDGRKRAAAEQTWASMVEGREIIAQAVLWNPQDRTYGVADILVRSDVLARLFPDAITAADAAQPAPAIPGATWHYRVLDIKFSTLSLNRDGHAGAKHRPHMVQIFLYNEALGRLQGVTAPSGYLLGRGWERGTTRGTSSMERLARVDRVPPLRADATDLRALATDACAWIRRVRREGGSWAPSMPELRPNRKNKHDAPWRDAKRKLGALSDPPSQAGPSGGPVSPRRVTANEGQWRHPAAAEFFVDFETVNDLNDDFARFPEKGGQPLIFMIGCGRYESGRWTFEVFTTDRLTPDEEARIIGDWLASVEKVTKARGCSLRDARFFHWSNAETSFIASAYNSAATRQSRPDWTGLPWVDLLVDVIREQPVSVHGARGNGLKEVANAMHRHGLIETVWKDGRMDGLAASAAAWSCDAKARSRGTSMNAEELMREVREYNEIDCRAMAEVLGFLRRHR